MLDRVLEIVKNQDILNFMKSPALPHTTEKKMTSGHLGKTTKLVKLHVIKLTLN